MLSLLVMLEHWRCTRQSQLSALYLLLTILFVASRLRTISHLSAWTLGPPLACSLVARTVLFASMQMSTRSSLVDGASLPPIETAGLVSQYLIVWVTPLLYRGYKNPLTMDDLGSIEPELYSSSLWEAFHPHWTHARVQHTKGGTRQPLLFAFVKAFLVLILSPVVPFFVNTWVSMARPLVILDTVTFVESFSSGTPKPLADGWGLVGGTLLIYLTYAISNALAEIAAQRCSLAVRGTLMEAIFRKTLLIRVETAKEMGAAKASNLMSVDVKNIVTNVSALHEVWTAVLMTGIGLYIIWTQIGLSFLASVGGAIVFFSLLPLLSKDIGAARTHWADSTDRRVKFISSVLRHIKAIKMSAYEACVTVKAVNMRETEVVALITWIMQILKVSIATNWLNNFLALVTVTTFTVVSIFSQNGGGAVTTARIFTVISTISLISMPLLMLGQRWSGLVTAWASWKRIEEFLLCEEKEAAKEENDEQDGLLLRPGGMDRHVRLGGASFGVRNKVTLLHEVEVDITNQRLWMIVGRVGSGKSTLLQSILGELDLLEGISSVNLGTVGFCSQDPWLRTNESIRANITFVHPFEAGWYAEVLRATGLDVDLGVMAEGDARATSNLSGGQKQRVALARAIYGRFDTLVLDDVFSALDAGTEAHVFEALFGTSGLLRRTSVILATNQVYRLVNASYITMLHAGRIVEQGTYAGLMAGESEVSRLVREFSAGKSTDKSSAEESTKDALQEPADEQRQEPSAMQAPDRETETKKAGKVGWSTYLVYLRGMGYVSAFFWVTFVILTAAVNTSISIYLQAFTTTLAGSPKRQYGVFLGGYAALQIAYLIVFCVAIINAFKYSHPEASRRIHRWMLAGLLGTTLEYFESRGIGQMVNRFNSDLNMIDMELPNHAVNVMFEITQIGGGMILIIVAAPYMAAVLVGTIMAMAMVQRFYLRSGRELRRLDLTSKSPIYTLFSETIDPDGLRTVRAMRAQALCRAANTTRTTSSQHPAWLIMVVRKWLELGLNLCVTCINTLLVVIAVIRRDSTSAGILAVALTSAADMTTQLSLMIVEWTNVEMGITSVERVQEYIELPPQKDRSGSKLSVGADWLTHGSVSFSHVSARYHPDLPPALDDVSFEITPGQKVGICGRTGSGKSTLLGVLWRLIEFDDMSRIAIDGTEIDDVPLQQYRAGMTIIPQDPLLLELSLHENLDPEGLHTDAQIWDALDRSQLKAHVEAMPNRLDEMMSGDGGNFSRGQRQLLALARAILRARPILALDEATSSIDVKTDAAIQQTIRESFEGATVMTIAHRISTIIDYDVIVVMDRGRVVEMGPPTDLLRRRDGHFRRLAMEGGAIDGDTPDVELVDEL